MADFVLGRLKFTFLGAWTTSYSYIKDDIVTYGGIAYACTGNHTSSSFFYNDISNWTKIAPGFNWAGAWQANTQYNLNDIVRYGSDAYIVITQHQSGDTNSWAANSANFQLFAGGLEFLNTYSTTVNYSIGDIVTYGGYSYVAQLNNINQQPNINTSAWSVLTTGYTAVGVYNPATKYEPGQVVNYGAYTYVNKVESTGILPSNGSYWTLVSKGQEYQGIYNSGSSYTAGDIVQFGGDTYIAKTETTGIAPTTSNTTQWSTFTTGVNYRGAYVTSTQYNAGDIVNLGGNNYIALTTTTNIAPTPANTTQWSTFTTGINYRGAYNNSTTYNSGDSVYYSNSTYILISTNATVGIIPPGNTSQWSIIAQGSVAGILTSPGDMFYQTTGGLARLPVGANGQILVISNTGLPNWESSSITANTFYVCTDTGVDDTFHGSSLQRPWKTIQYATQQITALNETAATISVKSGSYYEQLPITVPQGCSIVGDATRSVTVYPSSTGMSLDTTPVNNNVSTMFYMSDATTLSRLTMKGMVGFVANNAVSSNSYQTGTDITTSTIGGVFLRLSNTSPILTKSPYINDVTAISSGGVGVLIDGSVHSTGNKSMVFHSFTNIHDNGLGFYVTNNGRAEVVSCFTYFCYMGYVAANGGIIRALNGNNSYGTFGSVSVGYSLTETPITANIYGSILSYNAASIANGTSMTANNFIHGSVSGANGIVLSFQSSASEIYIKKTNSIPFANGELVYEITNSGGSYGAQTGISIQTTVSSTGPETGESGVLVTLNNITGNVANLVGDSIQFTTGTSNTGYDPYSYVISAVSSWTAQTNTAIVTLASTKPSSNPTYDGQAVIIRTQYSQIRLTGHDFLSIGTGGIANTNYPSVINPVGIPSNQVIQNYPGRVYYVTTDQSGNFSVGPYFGVNQATGVATLSASSFNLSGLTSLRLGSIGAQLGAQINEFSTDGTMAQNSSVKVPTQSAVVTYVASQLVNALPPLSGNTGNILSSTGTTKYWTNNLNTLNVVSLTSNTISSTNGTLSITTSNVNMSGNVSITGNLTVQGVTTTINTDVFQTTEYANVIIANTTTSNIISSNTLTINGITTIHEILETANIQSSGAGSTMSIYLNTGGVFYYTGSSTSNMTFNFVYNGVSTLNSVMSVGQSLSCAILVTQGGTAYYPTTFQVDGTSVTPKWSGGSAPSSGDSSSIDVYIFSIVKTASATYTVLGSATKFA